MSCEYCFEKSGLKEEGHSNLYFCNTECQQNFYHHIGTGFFDDNPGWIKDRDTFWLFFSTQPKRPSSFLLAGALRDANDETRAKVLRWLLDPTAPVKKAFGKSHEEFVRSLFRGAAVLRAIPLMQEIITLVPNFDLQNSPYLLKEMIATGRAESAAFLMGPLRDYNKELKMACENNHVGIVELLLKEGRANPAHHESICLTQAANMGNLDIVLLLLRDGRSNVYAQNYRALYTAIDDRSNEVIEALLDFDARISRDKLISFIKWHKGANEDEGYFNSFKSWVIQIWEENQ